MNSVRIELDRKNAYLKGATLADADRVRLTQQLPADLIPRWFLDILRDYPLIGTEWSLPEEQDLSGFGVEMKWLDAADIIGEATEFEPGRSVAALEYIPIGSCLLGSGDPYFLKIAHSEDPPFVRVPHELAAAETVDESGIDIVCNSLSEFLRQASIA